MSPKQHIDEARELLRTGRYEAALARLVEYEGWPSPQMEYAELLRAELLLARDPIDALEALARSSDLLRSEEVRFDYFVISGKAYANSRNFDGAAEMFTLAERAAEKDPIRLAWVAHHRARLRHLRGDFDPSDPNFAVALESPYPGRRMLTLATRSWMHAGQGNYRAQIADLRAAVALAREHPNEVEYYSLGRLVHALIRVGSETGEFDAVDDARELFESLEWSAELAEERFLPCVRSRGMRLCAVTQRARSGYSAMQKRLLRVMLGAWCRTLTAPTWRE